MQLLIRVAVITAAIAIAWPVWAVELPPLCTDPTPEERQKFQAFCEGLIEANAAIASKRAFVHEASPLVERIEQLTREIVGAPAGKPTK